MKSQLVSFLLFILFLLVACEKDERENEYAVSKNFTDESHKTGQDCMSCHVAGGDGEGWFTVAGSVFDKQDNPRGNGVVEFTTEPQSGGSIVASVEIDEKGNFYTTESILFGDGLFVTVESPQGNKAFMLTKVTNGSCNSCHGSVTDRIWVE